MKTEELLRNVKIPRVGSGSSFEETKSLGLEGSPPTYILQLASEMRRLAFMNNIFLSHLLLHVSDQSLEG